MWNKATTKVTRTGLFEGTKPDMCPKAWPKVTLPYHPALLGSIWAPPISIERRTILLTSGLHSFWKSIRKSSPKLLFSCLAFSDNSPKPKIPIRPSLHFHLRLNGCLFEQPNLVAFIGEEMDRKDQWKKEQRTEVICISNGQSSTEYLKHSFKKHSGFEIVHVTRLTPIQSKLKWHEIGKSISWKVHAKMWWKMDAAGLGV